MMQRNVALAKFSPSSGSYADPRHLLCQTSSLPTACKLSLHSACFFARTMLYYLRMKYNYLSLYNKNAAFYNARPRAKKALTVANQALTYAFFLAYGLLWIYAFCKRNFPSADYLRLLFAPVTTLVVATVFRWAIRRPRPYSEQGANIQSLVKKNKDRDSCPSRHLACAAVISVTFLPFFPVIGVGLLLLCPCLAYTRFALGLHYPSDLLFGFGLGGMLGLFTFFL